MTKTAWDIGQAVVNTVGGRGLRVDADGKLSVVELEALAAALRAQGFEAEAWGDALQVNGFRVTFKRDAGEFVVHIDAEGDGQ